jgi:hypothetical protein
MKVTEIITESNSENSNATDQAGTTKKSGKMHDHFKSSIKGMHTYPGNHTYYDMYRFGVDMAGSPDDYNTYDPASPIANQLVTLSYSDADQKIIDKSKKKMGFKSKKLTPNDSKEPSDTSNTSPVAKVKRNKYGV